MNEILIIINLCVTVLLVAYIWHQAEAFRKLTDFTNTMINLHQKKIDDIHNLVNQLSPSFSKYKIEMKKLHAKKVIR